jgi:hypothetical protein
MFSFSFSFLTDQFRLSAVMRGRFARIRYMKRDCQPRGIMKISEPALTWAPIYKSPLMMSILPARNMAKVTAGLMCPPDMPALE